MVKTQHESYGVVMISPFVPCCSPSSESIGVAWWTIRNWRNMGCQMSQQISETLPCPEAWSCVLQPVLIAICLTFPLNLHWTDLQPP